jgi:acetylornithine/succinyldiaminopimelate/putrescine aminotransferase
VPSSSIPASTAAEPARRDSLSPADTCARLVRDRIPNLFRLYLNPYLVQTCVCLSRYVTRTWPADVTGAAYPSFLANSSDEALSGAIKLARYHANQQGRSPLGLVLDRAGRLGPFVGVQVPGHDRIEFIPGLRVVGPDSTLSEEAFGFALLDAAQPISDQDAAALEAIVRRTRPLVILRVDRRSLAALQQRDGGLLRELRPDIVVFDESFVERQVPFAAFTARPDLYAPWQTKGQKTFHSTTFQPNAITSLHFLRCLEAADPSFFATLASELERIARDPQHCLHLLSTLYSPFLAGALEALAFDTFDVTAAGHFVTVGGATVFDGVAGVACSVRGHNPAGYVRELEELDDVDVLRALTERVAALTGLECLLPAVSGATAVETALRLALIAQAPKRCVVAFRGGFGGKTLFALTGTANPAYKTNLSPLYEHVVYLDPFAPTVLQDLEEVLHAHAVAVVQLELIQGVGGVRPLPAALLDYLQANRGRWGYLLFVDEVQTGMYRTGTFTLSEKLGLTPDLLTVGKAVSDMMFPFALTAYSAALQSRVDAACPDVIPALRQAFGYEYGYRTALNVLIRAEAEGVPPHVAQAGALFTDLLTTELAGCRAVREVRVHGLLIGIELATDGWVRRRLGKQLGPLYMLALRWHRPFPVLIGFCQYEPHVLKLTPPLSTTPEEVRHICATITTILKQSLWRIILTALTTLPRSLLRRRRRARA